LAWTLEFSLSAQKTLRGMDRADARRIVSFLRDRVAVRDNPRSVGSALKSDKYANKWRYRVGDYCIIAEIKDNVVMIVAVEVGHRREVYR
jgi:mRNA interferase RelE/StbE